MPAWLPTSAVEWRAVTAVQDSTLDKPSARHEEMPSTVNCKAKVKVKVSGVSDQTTNHSDITFLECYSLS